MPGDVRPYISPGAPVEMNSRGQFVLAQGRAPEEVPIISPERAGELAVAFVKTWGAGFEKGWQHQRGGPIDIDNLQMEQRIYFAETPHRTLAPSQSRSLHRHFGPHYLVHFSAGGATVLLVAVSAYATDVTVGSDGRIYGGTTGGEFKATAVSIDPGRGPTRYTPISPEQAVGLVGTRTGARIVSTPQLMLRDRRWAAALAQWKLVLDRPVHVRNPATGNQSVTRELYVGPGGHISIPAERQPLSRPVVLSGEGETRMATPQERRQVIPPRVVQLENLVGIPTVFDEVLLEERRAQ